MTPQEVVAAADQIRTDINPNFGIYVTRDRKSLELICLELKLEPTDSNLAHVAALLEAKGISLAEAFPKMKYRSTGPESWESRIVESEAEEGELPADGAAWTDAPPLPIEEDPPKPAAPVAAPAPVVPVMPPVPAPVLADPIIV